VTYQVLTDEPVIIPPIMAGMKQTMREVARALKWIDERVIFLLNQHGIAKREETIIGINGCLIRSADKRGPEGVPLGYGKGRIGSGTKGGDQHEQR